VNIHERKAEKRRAQLRDIEDRVAAGTLTVRPMTEAERRRFGLEDADRSFRRFFFPGARPGTRRGEDAYQRAARAMRAQTGTEATSRRIYSVECSLDGDRRRLQVGEPAPASGRDVITAIFELGDGGDLVVCTGAEPVAMRVAARGADVVEFA
jgi:hypothetical protein